MRIAVTRKGGFAGISEKLVTRDIAELPSGERERASETIRRIAEIARAPDSPPAIGADLLHYEIELEDGAERHSWHVADDASPRADELRRLITSLG